MHAERRILLGEFLKGNAHLLLVVLRRRLHRNGDNRIRELHRLKDDGIILIAERITRCRVLEPNRRRNITAVDHIDLLAVVRVHLEDASDALLVVLRRVVDIGTGVQHAGVNAEERKLADERIRHNLERECRERSCIRSRTAVRFARIRVHTRNWRDVRRCRHIVNNGIEQRLNALVAI